MFGYDLIQNKIVITCRYMTELEKVGIDLEETPIVVKAKGIFNFIN